MNSGFYPLFGKRFFDFFASLILLIAAFPFLLIFGVIIKSESKGSAIIRQKRVGLAGKLFTLYKLRTMLEQTANTSSISLGMSDNRITKFGYWLRKRKLDELPQLWNVLKGEMSFVGPRPLVETEIAIYPIDYKPLLGVKPGLTDPASIRYFNENEILASQENPLTYYNEQILPDKIKLSKAYLIKISLYNDLKMIVETGKKVLSSF